MREIWTRGRRIVGVNRFTVLWQLIRMHHFNGDVSSSLDDVIWIFLRTFAIGKIDSHWCHFANRPSLCLSLSASFTGQHTIIKMWSTYHLSLSLAVAQWHKLSLPPSLSLSRSLSLYLSLSLSLAVWPDWAIFESSRVQIFLQSSPVFLTTC